MADNIKIIQSSEGKWEFYREIRLESLKEDPQAFGSSYGDALAYPEEKWRERAGNKFTLLAMSGDKPVGTISAFIVEDDGLKVAHIVGVYVSKEFRGMGIGGRLLEEELKKLKQDKTIDKVVLDVNKDQISAVGLYQKCGFKINGEEKRILGDGKEYIEYKMELLKEN